MILADKLVELRKKNGWSQEELAAQLGVSRQSVSKWEGAQSVPDLEKIVRLAELFGVSTDYLLKDEIAGEDTAARTAPGVVGGGRRRVTVEEANAFLTAKASAAKAAMLRTEGNRREKWRIDTSFFPKSINVTGTQKRAETVGRRRKLPSRPEMSQSAR